MSRSDDQRIADIREAADQLKELVVAGRDRFFDEWIRQRASERLLEIIGEAANALSDEFKVDHPDIEWRHIVNLRHLLAHHYHRIDPDQIWSMIMSDVPALVDRLAPRTG